MFQTSAQVRDIPCGTRGGVMVYFEKIEVVNQLSEAYVINTTRRFGLEYDKNLIFDKVHHEINQLCSRSTLQVSFRCMGPEICLWGSGHRTHNP